MRKDLKPRFLHSSRALNLESLDIPVVFAALFTVESGGSFNSCPLLVVSAPPSPPRGDGWVALVV